MKKMLGVAAAMLICAPIVQASVMPQKDVARLTTTDQKTVLHTSTVLALGGTKCNGVNIRVAPECAN
ncbi:MULTISPECIES: hypothetical protein [Pseudomonas syringae group]|uniref:hypothetical protein n=1 Tax=Pseudomonas syringae group TaxID=136849 RepID=UPI000A24E35A|nr:MULTISPECIES: hypothetical protein [Pseudomonas syringae group]MBM0211475.1 hypothetical protein [Pseudomonas syringae pv. maculicola]MCF5222303.1 hypothetical protein [Pseudomonas syringae]MCF5240297.1 hypothetical protein [Pseudomonas syringae]NAO30066.1 hypothetical protein [Pseudomonas syringae pv. dysoxyli]OSN24788.1 hypothetical protein BV339_00327 [Pseudomonas syringae pv. actinidiae]